jgi:hypothetical protein
MDWLKRHWVAICGLFLTGLFIYLQLLQWKRHGDDLMLTAASIVVTALLWVTLVAAALRYRRLGTTDEGANSTPSPTWVRFLTAYPVIAGLPSPGKEPAKKPQKVRCEFLNCADFSYKVKMIGWECGSRGLDADLWRGVLQLRLANSWYPESTGVEELHVPPGESFRFWVFPKSVFSDEQFRARVNSGTLGTVHLLINGKEIAVSVG